MVVLEQLVDVVNLLFLGAALLDGCDKRHKQTHVYLLVPKPNTISYWNQIHLVEIYEVIIIAEGDDHGIFWDPADLRSTHYVFSLSDSQTINQLSLRLLMLLPLFFRFIFILLNDFQEAQDALFTMFALAAFFILTKNLVSLDIVLDNFNGDVVLVLAQQWEVWGVSVSIHANRCGLSWKYALTQHRFLHHTKFQVTFLAHHTIWTFSYTYFLCLGYIEPLKFVTIIPKRQRATRVFFSRACSKMQLVWFIKILLMMEISCLLTSTVLHNNWDKWYKPSLWFDRVLHKAIFVVLWCFDTITPSSIHSLNRLLLRLHFRKVDVFIHREVFYLIFWLVDFKAF